MAQRWRTRFPGSLEVEFLGKRWNILQLHTRSPFVLFTTMTCFEWKSPPDFSFSCSGGLHSIEHYWMERCWPLPILYSHLLVNQNGCLSLSPAQSRPTTLMHPRNAARNVGPLCEEGRGKIKLQLVGLVMAHLILCTNLLTISTKTDYRGGWNVLLASLVVRDISKRTSASTLFVVYSCLWGLILWIFVSFTKSKASF